MQYDPPYSTKKSTLKLAEPATSSAEGLILGRLPDSKAESDLVDEVCKVVDEVEAAVIDTAHEVAKEVASGIDGPACCHNETHGAEGGLDIPIAPAKADRSEGSYIQFHVVCQKLDLGTWKLDNYGYLLGLETWDPGNIGKPQLLITWEPANILKRTILMT